MYVSDKLVVFKSTLEETIGMPLEDYIFCSVPFTGTWAPNLQSNIKRFTAVTLALYDALIGENKIPLEIAGLIFMIVHQTQADGYEKEYSAEEDK